MQSCRRTMVGQINNTDGVTAFAQLGDKERLVYGSYRRMHNEIFYTALHSVYQFSIISVVACEFFCILVCTATRVSFGL